MSASSRSAFQIAVGALSRRELTSSELVTRLLRAGVERAEAETVAARLEEDGYQSNARAAMERARVLASRPVGDAAIAADLGRRGLSRDEISTALAEVGPEIDRARSLATRLGPGPRLSRTLSTRGFSHETVDALLGAGIADGP